MRRAMEIGIGVVLVALLVGTLAGVAGGQEASDDLAIERVYPNPVASGDEGEYVVLSLPDDVNRSSVSLTDGTTTVSLSNVSRDGQVAITATPNVTATITDAPVAESSGLALANGGETLSLTVHGEVRSEVRYTDAPEGEIAIYDGNRLQWRPLGATDFDVTTAGPAEVRAFVLPDNPDLAVSLLQRADHRIRLGGYTLSSERVADALIAADERGVDVRVLLEGAPVGGRTRAGAAQLDRLAAAGVDVRVVGGDHARVDYHHAKYAVVDDRALVMTENWKPAGTGGNGSRGWGVVTGQAAIVENLSRTFAADASWRDGLQWDRFRQGRSFERGGHAGGQYPTTFDARELQVNRTELLVTPDNGGDQLAELLEEADESISVVQASLGDWNDRLPTALRRAAQRDVEVRILLSSAWYSKSENRASVERFREWAERSQVSLEIKLAEPDDRFEKIHAKGAIIDGDQVVLGSLNWNDAAMTSNREVLVVLHGSQPAEYYRQVFDADWAGGTGQSLPVGLIFAALGAVLLAGAVLAKIRFERDGGPTGVGPPASGD